MHEIEVFDTLTEMSAQNPELYRMSALMDALHHGGFDVWFHDLTEEPDAAKEHEEAARILAEEGEACLPLTFVRGTLLSKGAYPATEALGDALGIEFVESSGCGCGCGGGCCGEDEGSCCGEEESSCCGGDDSCHCGSGCCE